MPLPFGLNQAGMDAVDLHPIFLAQVCKAFGEGSDRSIDRAANGEILFRLASAATGNGKKRTAPLLQQRPGSAGEAYMCKKFQCIAFRPVGIAQRKEIAPLGGAGIIDQNIEPAEGASRFLDQ
jgi:hypothetical protein